MPVAVGDDEFPRVRSFDAVAHRLEYVVNGARAREIDTGSAAGVVKMIVGEARDHRHPAQIDQLSVRACDPAHRVVGTNNGELVAGDCDGLRVRELVVDGYDLGVVVDDVRSRSAASDLALR